MPESISAPTSAVGFGLALDNLIPIDAMPDSPDLRPLPLAATAAYASEGVASSHVIGGPPALVLPGAADGEAVMPTRGVSLDRSQFKYTPAASLKSSVLGVGSTAAVILVVDPSTGITYAEKNVAIPSHDKSFSTASRRSPVSSGPNSYSGTPRASGLVEHDFAKRFLSFTASKYLEPAKADAIAGIVGVFSSRVENCNLHLALEYMDLGSVARPQGLPNDVVAAVTRQVLEGLKILSQDLHVMHRDIKPENILCKASGDVKLSDFGCAALLDDLFPFANDQVGTTLQMSPERLRGERHSYASDVWSLGVTVAQLALGRHPFVTDGRALVSQERFWLLAETLRFTSSDADCAEATKAAVDSVCATLDHHLREFLELCLSPNPNARPDVLSLIRHPFVHHLSLDDARRVCRSYFGEEKATAMRVAADSSSPILPVPILPARDTTFRG
jgi:serine/threonine protein kinase